jgi:hypothetical protein
MNKTNRESRKLRIGLLLMLLAISVCLQAASVYAASITVTADKAQYVRGETVQITGTLTNEGSRIVGVDVAVEVKNKDGVKVFEQQLKTDGAGAFATTLKIRESFQTGLYTIYAAYQADRETADFELLSGFTLTVTVIGTGSVAKNPDQASYHYGDVVQLTANPGTGWGFTGWSGDLTGSTNPTTIPMSANKAVTATFTLSIASQLEIVKIAAGGDGTFGFTVTGPTPSSPSIKTSGGTGTTGFFPVTAGTYTVTESTIPGGWVLAGGSCSLEGGTGTFSPIGFTLPLGGKVTCTFRDENPAGLQPAVKSKTIFGDEFSGVRVKVQWRESRHMRTRTLSTPSSLDLQPGLYKFTAPSTARVNGVQYRFDHWEDETGAISGSRSLSYNVQSGKTLYAVYGPRKYTLTVEVKDLTTRAWVPGATVEVTQLGHTYVGTTSSRGRVRFTGIYAGQPVTLTITKDGY